MDEVRCNPSIQDQIWVLDIPSLLRLIAKILNQLGIGNIEKIVDEV